MGGGDEAEGEQVKREEEAMNYGWHLLSTTTEVCSSSTTILSILADGIINLVQDF